VRGRGGKDPARSTYPTVGGPWGETSAEGREENEVEGVTVEKKKKEEGGGRILRGKGREYPLWPKLSTRRQGGMKKKREESPKSQEKKEKKREGGVRTKGRKMILPRGLLPRENG